MYEVDTTGIHDGVTAGAVSLPPDVTPGGALASQVRKTMVSTDPGAVVVDTEKVVDSLREVPTSVLVRVGVETHVSAMLESAFYLMKGSKRRDREKTSTKSAWIFRELQVFEQVEAVARVRERRIDGAALGRKRKCL